MSTAGGDELSANMLLITACLGVVGLGEVGGSNGEADCALDPAALSFGLLMLKRIQYIKSFCTITK